MRILSSCLVIFFLCLFAPDMGHSEPEHSDSSHHCVVHCQQHSCVYEVKEAQVKVPVQEVSSYLFLSSEEALTFLFIKKIPHPPQVLI